MYDTNDKSVCFDFFNEEGVYLHEVTMPFYPRALVGQYLYRFDSIRETGYVVIKRYRITNLDQLKTGIVDPHHLEAKELGGGVEF